MNITSRAIAFLIQQQLASGGFESLSATEIESFSTSKHYLTNFTNALILNSIQEVPIKNNPAITHLKNRLAQFLLTAKSQTWTWNYWAQPSPAAKNFPLPDDLDDSSCAWAALYRHQSEIFTGKVLAQVTHLLVRLETKPGGPYHTWVIDNTKYHRWSGVDLAVNSNIAYFLKLIQVELPTLTSFFDQKINTCRYHSQYYPTPYPVIYFLARSYQGELKHKVISHLLKLRRGDLTWGNPLNTALANISLLRLGHYLPELATHTVEYFQKTQLANGSWPASGFCYDPSINHQPHYAGSASLTTALVLEYLAVVDQVVKDAHSSSTLLSKGYIAKKKLLGSAIKSKNENWLKISSYLLKLEKNLQPLVKTSLHKLARADQKHHISTWSSQFAQALSNPNQNKISYLSQLDLANLWGWLAYTIYDDIIDQDTTPIALPLANIAQRQLMATYQPILNRWPQFWSILTKIMNQIDVANFCELNNRAKIELHLQSKTLFLPAKMPTHSPLTAIAHKSIGHALGPLAIIHQLGYSLGDEPTQKWLTFMSHYLTARQLNDDLHDWKNDLLKGHLTPVVIEVLTTARIQSRSIKLTPGNIDHLKQVFWKQILPKFNSDIIVQLKLATQALTNNPIVVQPHFFAHLLGKVTAIVTKTMSKQQQAIEFMSAY